jgi:hypothetical protein
MNREIKLVASTISLVLVLVGCAGSPSTSETLLDKEDETIGTFCSSFRNLLKVWEESEGLIFASALIQRGSITGMKTSLEGLIKESSLADERLVGYDLTTLEDENRNNTGEISAADLAFFASQALNTINLAESTESFAPSQVDKSSLIPVRDMCREFPNSINIDELLEESGN